MRKDYCKVPLIHMIQFLPHPKLQGSFCNIYKFYGIMKVWRSMSGRFTSKMKFSFFSSYTGNIYPISFFCKICLFFLSIGHEIPVNLLIMGGFFYITEKNFYSRTSSHWSMFPKCTACRLSTSTSCGKLFLMIMTPFSLSCFSPPPAMPPMVLSSVKTVPSL